MGSIDHPFNPLAVAAGAGGTFIARTMDRDPKHLRVILKEAHEHRGTSLIEIYQNCNVFNDGAFQVYTDKATKANTTVFLEDGKPMIFGAENDKGVRLEGAHPVVVDLDSGDYSPDDLWVHDKSDRFKAGILLRCFDSPDASCDSLPRPFGVFYSEEKTRYEDLLHDQIRVSLEKNGEGDLDALLRGPNTWEID
jgi:2-oxoglutarate ferredoxin oxidoreductase subunit beta